MQRKWAVNIVLALVCSGAFAQSTPEGAVQEGAVLEASNLDVLRTKSFLGHNIGEMLTPGQARLIKEFGLKMRLAKPQPIHQPETWVKLTEEYASQLKFDPDSKLIDGWLAGQPFPQLDMADSYLGWKIIWNMHVGMFNFADVTQTPAPAFSIDSKKGLERSNTIVVYNVRVKGRLHEPHILEEGPVERRQLVFQTEPYDTAGIGVYFQRYDDGRPDESWVYVKSVRRVRRVASNVWFDPVPGGDLGNDDLNCFNAFPTWYQDFRVLEKKTVLLVTHATVGSTDLDADAGAIFDFQTPPHWNYRDQPWEPTEVYVLEQIPPPEHPYSRRVAYYHHVLSMAPACDMYDKKGELWKVFFPIVAPLVKGNGEWGYGSPSNLSVDVQRARGTVVFNPWIWSDMAEQDPSEVSPKNLADYQRYTTRALGRRYGPSNYAGVEEKSRAE